MTGTGTTVRPDVAQQILPWLMQQVMVMDGVGTRTGGGAGIARAMGARAETVAGPAEPGAAFLRAKAADRTAVIVMQVDPRGGRTTRGLAGRAAGTPEVSAIPALLGRHAAVGAGPTAQRRGM